MKKTLYTLALVLLNLVFVFAHTAGKQAAAQSAGDSKNIRLPKDAKPAAATPQSTAPPKQIPLPKNTQQVQQQNPPAAQPKLIKLPPKDTKIQSQ